MVERGRRDVAALSYSATVFRGRASSLDGKEVSPSPLGVRSASRWVASISNSFRDLIGVTVPANIFVGIQQSGSFGIIFCIECRGYGSDKCTDTGEWIYVSLASLSNVWIRMQSRFTAARTHAQNCVK